MANSSELFEMTQGRAPARVSSLPLAVDLDGTLVSTDVMVESCFIFAKKYPLQLFRMPFWIANPARFKHHLASEAVPDVRTLPYHREVVAYLKEEKQRGRKLVLATGADEAVARQVAQELGLFDAVFASDGVTNLKGDRKRDRLVKEFGLKGFAYAGNSTSDRSVWKAAQETILVHPAAGPRAISESDSGFDRVFHPDSPGWWPYLSALRPSHWLKDALVFLPLLAAHQVYDLTMLAHAVLAFVVLSLCASSVYLLNDLVDLDEDRQHAQKKYRMLASGRLPITHALVIAPTLVLLAILLSLFQPALFLLTVAAYCILMLAYCLKLRSLALWDVATLAAGYSLRVVAGAVAVRIAVSPWLMSSVFLLFLGLALLKRYAELTNHRLNDRPNGSVRGYAIEDSGRVALYGCLSSYIALVAFGVYLAGDSNRQLRYELIWVSYALLAYWITRMWLMAQRGEIKSDPVSFAISDRPSRLVGVLMAVTVLVAG
ncbi:MAG TPA: UbiA family prenyltransferase [Candidatus Binataceae bacterium]|nr:UbiA family prenyltransferase [Candidatus Binataceae bacterium]